MIDRAISGFESKKKMYTKNIHGKFVDTSTLHYWRFLFVTTELTNMQEPCILEVW